MITPSFMELFREGNCRIYSVELPGSDKQLVKAFQDKLFRQHLGNLPSDTYVHCIYPDLKIPHLETGDEVIDKEYELKVFTTGLSHYRTRKYVE